MIGFEKILSETVGYNPGTPMSVLSIMTANPKYLIFIENDSHPRYVLQFGATTELYPVYSKMKELSLHSKLADVIPRPLSISNVNADTSLFIQEGISGRPWFSIRSMIKTEGGWQRLLYKCVSSLQLFHTSVGDLPNWILVNSPSDSLKEKATWYKNHSETLLPEYYDSVVEKHITHLSRLECLPCISQHGDFCINNLIVSDSQIGIVDFEHFGTNYVPLHDEFMLLHSLMSFSLSSTFNIWNETWETIMSNCYYSNTIDSGYHKSLYLHFLLWWIAECHTNSRRSEMKNYYIELLAKFLKLDFNNVDWSPFDYMHYQPG